MPKRKTIEEEINAFFELWDFKQQIAFLRDIIPLFEIYDIEDEGDWVEKIGGDQEYIRTVRMVRVCYLVSRICEFHAGRLCRTNVDFKNLWKRMEKIGLEKGDVHGQEDKEATERDEAVSKR